MMNCELTPTEVIAFARETIRKTCAGRKCLDECLQRVAAAALAPSPCGGGRGRGVHYAHGVCHFFGNIKKSILRKVRRATAFTFWAVFSLYSFVSLGDNDVECYWENGVFRCDGAGGETIYGDTVVVNGGGTGGGNGITIITNIWGCCTNCVNMSPEQVEEIKQSIKSICNDSYSGILYFCENISYYAQNVIVDSNEITFDGDKMIEFPRERYMPTTFDFVTNFISICSSSAYSQIQCTIVTSAADSQQNAIQKTMYASGAGNAVYDYYNFTVRPYVDTSLRSLEAITNSNNEIRAAVSRVIALTDSLSSEACPSDNCPTNWPGGGDGGQATGNWCTYEQGEAIKEWLSKQEDWLKKINNQLKGLHNTLTHGLYSEYTHIPENADWRSIYLSGNPTIWGYDPTNTLQRIEMLLFGIVMTNGLSSSYSDIYDTTEDEEKLQSLSNDLVVAWSDFPTDTNNFAAVVSPSQDLYQALRRLFNSFHPRDADFEGGEVLIGSATIGDGDNSVVVPAITLGTSEDDGGGLVPFVRTVKGFLHTFLSFFYILVGACVVWQCWGYFVDWALRLSHWGIELVSQIFA